MAPKFLSVTTILHPSPKQTRKARKSLRDQEALIASEVQAQSELAPLDFDDTNDTDDDDENHSDRPGPPETAKAAAASRTRDVKQGAKNWLRRLTRRPKRQPTRHPALPPDGSRSRLLALPGELQNNIISFLNPVAQGLLRLSCRHFYRIIPPPAFIDAFSSPPLEVPIPSWMPDPVQLLHCHRFAFLTALHRAPTGAPSPYLPPNWNVHAAVCGRPFYPCTGCKAFHHLDWFAPYGAAVRRYPALADRPVDCRACVLHTWMPGEEDGLYSPEVWPGFAERWRGWSVGRWWRCECCGRCVRDGEEVVRGGERDEEEVGRAEIRADDVEGWFGGGVDVRTGKEWDSRSAGRYLMAVQGTAGKVRSGGGRCVCGCDVCAMVGIDCWERGGRTVVLFGSGRVRVGGDGGWVRRFGS